jgi:hypothetical protein
LIGFGSTPNRFMNRLRIGAVVVGFIVARHQRPRQWWPNGAAATLSQVAGEHPQAIFRCARLGLWLPYRARFRANAK